MTLDFSPDIHSKKRATAAMLGTSGSGKTSLVNEWAIKALNRQRPVLIVDLQSQFEHLGPEVSVQPDFESLVNGEFADELMLSEWRGLLVLDDCDAYLDGKGKIPAPWSRLFSSNRHFRIDIVSNARRVQETPKMLLSAARYLAIFQCHDDLSLERISREIHNVKGAIEAIPTKPHENLLIDRQSRTFSRHKTMRLPPEAE